MSDSCERCKGWDFWDIGAQHKYFFKVMLGDFRRRMTIPRKFARRFRDMIRGTTKLKACNGHTCTAVVAKYLNKLVLEEGWEAFVSANDIRLGDFLVFRYNGNFQFDVLIFDPSCCVKASSNVEGDICDNVQQRHRDSIKTSSSGIGQMSRCPTRIQKKGSNKCNKKTDLTSSTGHLSVSDDSSSEYDQEIPPVPSCIFPYRAHLTQTQRMKVEKKVLTLRSGIPIFGAVMIKTNITRNPCYLGFCRKYADQYLPSEDQIIRLHRNGRWWQVQFRITKRNSMGLSRGWKQFVRDNKLQIGDICLFELLKIKKELMMDVHIVRK